MSEAIDECVELLSRSVPWHVIDRYNLWDATWYEGQSLAAYKYKIECAECNCCGGLGDDCQCQCHSGNETPPAVRECKRSCVIVARNFGLTVDVCLTTVMGTTVTASVMVIMTTNEIVFRYICMCTYLLIDVVKRINV